MNGKPALTAVDKRILKMLLTPDGKHSSKSLARKLGIPATTVQRRRKRLEQFLEIAYTLCLKTFGWHKVDFLIATESGRAGFIGKELLKRDEGIYVGKRIGQHTIELRVETILEDNAKILRIMELLEGMPGIKKEIWAEVV